MSNNRRRKRTAAAWAATLLCSVPFAASACNTEPYIGSVCTFAMNFCPQGYLPADGRTVAVNENQALFSLFGFTYGGDGRTTFGLPDLRGRAAVGTGAGAAGLAAVALGQKTGQQQLTLSPAQTPLAVHTHAATFAPVTGNNIVNIPGAAGTLAVTAALPVSPTLGTASGSTLALGAGQTGYLAGVSGTTGVDGVTFTGLYTPTVPGSNAAFLPAQVTVNGSPARPAVDVQVASVTGGAVTVAAAAAPATAAVSTQSPIIGMTVCIASMGLYPTRP